MADSSSSKKFQCKYDVFLSFRGKETRTHFTSHLYHALRRKGINTFIDGKIERGEEITSSIVDAIIGSRISIVIFSPDYASSPYCLDELLTMLACKDESKRHVVFPIFYKVDPVDVEHQTGTFGQAFDKLEGHSEEKVKRWREALAKAAELSGWHLDDGDEAKFIQSIVETVSVKLNRKLLPLPEHNVGIEYRVEEVICMLSIGLKDVRMVGICGTGGIGKTTLAKAIYNKIANQFEGSCFLENVRKTSEQALQETVLIELIGDKNVLVGNFARGINCIEERLCNKRVLIVIDDVDNVVQLKSLGGLNCFGAGSRIIITTRDEHLLVVHGVERERVYKIKELHPNDALVLFSWNAFKNSQPPDDYAELAHRFLNYARGLPLALVVLGSFLYRRKVPEWESEIAKLRQSPNKHIFEILKVSYDGLEDNEKAIFLDIACFFKGMDKDVVIKILEACDFNPVIGVQVLIEKSLISIENNKMQMHALLQSMGKEVVRQQSLKPNRRSRLWFYKDVIEVLAGNMGTDDIEGILIDLPESEEIQLSAEAFVKMKRLRILLIRNAHITGGPVDLPNELRWLEWPSCPLPSMPSGLWGRKLVGLNMHRSCIRQFGEGFKNYLTFMDLRDCESLIETPDFSFIPNLERLNLGGCSNLVEVHQSVGYLEKLEFLSFEFCFNLKSLPKKFKLRSLRTLLLTGCTKLEAFPDIVEEMKWLEKVCLHGTAIKVLPSSIENLTGLKVLTVTYCKILTNIPSSIYKLRHLKRLLLEGCSRLDEFPLNCNGHSLSGFPTLRFLDLRNCRLSGINFLVDHHCFSMLRDLDLSGNDFISLPPSIHLLNCLRSLKLSNCKKVKEIPELPINMKSVEARDCGSLERFSQFQRIFKCNKEDRPNRLHDIDFSNCHKLAENEGNFLENSLLSKKFRQDRRVEIFLPGSEIPECFSYFSEKDSLSFQVPSQKCEKIRALVLCAILSLRDGETANISREVFINGQNVIRFSRQFFSLESDHMWLYYLPRRFIKGLHLKQNGSSHFEVSFEVLGASAGSTLKRCGVYLVYKPNEVVEDSSVSRSVSCQMESMSFDLKRSCDNDLVCDVDLKVKKRTTEASQMAKNCVERHLELPMPFNIGEQQGKQWLSLSLQPHRNQTMEEHGTTFNTQGN